MDKDVERYTVRHLMDVKWSVDQIPQRKNTTLPSGPRRVRLGM